MTYWKRKIRLRYMMDRDVDPVIIGENFARVIVKHFPNETNESHNKFDMELFDIVEAFKDVEGETVDDKTADFDDTMGRFYDWCDENRIWIE